MLKSMTAFASASGSSQTDTWTLELRGVNGRGLELRLRLPDSLAAHEQRLRGMLSKRLSRGNVALTIRMTRQDAAASLDLDARQLDAVLGALDKIQNRALELGITLAQPTAADVLMQRGVVSSAPDTVTTQASAPLDPAFEAAIEAALDDFCTMRANEGRALQKVLMTQIDEIADLTEQASKAAAARLPQVEAQLTAALARISAASSDADPHRTTQELALLATKTDVTEELDRLRTHVTSARDLINSAGPHGRKLDFLSQEFNREANTLCAKSQDPTLTKVGLALKAAIDQMREQIQNVE